MKNIRYKVLLLMMISAKNAEAFTSDDIVHPTAHIAGSYALTHAGTVVCKKVTSLGKTPCSLIAGGLTAGLGLAVELKQKQKKDRFALGLAEDALGIGLAIGFIHLDF